MARTRSELRDAVSEETGMSGSAFNDKMNRHLDQAGGVIYTVRWQWRYETATLPIYNEVIKYALHSSVQSIDPDSIYISGDKLIAGSLREIYLDPPSTVGQPRKFNVAGMTGTSRQIYVGCKTAFVSGGDPAFTMSYGYWARAQGFAVDTSISPISYAYGDEPLIDYACYLLYTSQEQIQKAENCLKKFLMHIKVMETNLVYSGPSYTDMLQGVRELLERNETN